MKTNYLLVLFILFFMTPLSLLHAYVQNRTQGNELVQWPKNNRSINVYINPTNSQAISNEEVMRQATQSISEWNGKSEIGLKANLTTSVAQENVSEIYFSNDPSIFNGSGVVGVTQVLFKDNTGEILEADILISDNPSDSFSTDVMEVNYLGNVITHELGHFLGLGHSQVLGSSMFYALSRGQSQLSGDDASGLYSIYPNGNSSKGSIYGKIIGGKALHGVFGTHVQAISQKSGRVEASAISDSDGSFRIDGLTINDSYFIYTSPIVPVGLPSKYANARSNFCESAKNYRGSFFQSCESSTEGFPQEIRLGSSSVNVGNITIRCNLDVPTEYIRNKDTNNVFELLNLRDPLKGNSFTGYFSKQEVESLNPSDTFRVNYSGNLFSSIPLSENLYLEVKILNQSLYSPFKANVSIKRPSGTLEVTPKYKQQTDGWLSLETVARVPIKRQNLSDNDFEISITPEVMDKKSTPPRFPTDLPFDQIDFFPGAGKFEDSMYLYLASVSIVRDNLDGSFSSIVTKTSQFSDNTQCPDAIKTYALTDFSVKRNVASSSARKKDDILACGSVDLNGSSGNGPGGFFIGLILSLILGSLTTSIIKHNRSKHYSKLA